MTAGLNLRLLLLCCYSLISNTNSSSFSRGPYFPTDHLFLNNNSSAQHSFKNSYEFKYKLDYGLSNFVIPKHYKIHLFPSFTERTFTGKVSINITLLSRQDHIRLHAKNLDVIETRLKFEGYGLIPVEGYENKKYEFWIIQKQDGSSFWPGDYKLGLRFRGSLTNGIVGFYRSSYTDTRDNSTKYVVSTKFQPTYARRAFPCFDEPRFKSTFSIRLVKPWNLVALSNMPAVVEMPDTPSPGLTTVIFKRSLPMVTYLVAVAIGDFACLKSWTKRRLPVRICTTADKIQGGEYASAITPKIVDYYEKYFRIPFPLPKLDLVGIPEFPAGASEHWGMISFTEEYLLFQPGVGSGTDQQMVITVIAHELAHSWLGNLVTINAWNEVFLSEGFATYMQYKGSDAAEPTWNMKEQFVSDTLTGVLASDGETESHPLIKDSQNVQTPADIAALFDSISYSKGASIFRMLANNILRPASFRAGISAFLLKYSFSNVESKDLWAALQPYSQNSRNVSRIMQIWSRQAGYPVVSLEQREYDGVWILKQKRFLPLPSSTLEHYKWEIPVGIQWAEEDNEKKVQLGKKRIIWLHQNGRRVILPINPATSWVKLNVGQFGYYRVLYPDWMYMTLRSKLQKYFSPAERCGIVDDAFALSTAGYLEYKISLEFAKFLKRERNYIPWSCAATHLRKLGKRIKTNNPESHDWFQRYVLDLITTIYQRLRWNDSANDHLERRLKGLIFSLACENGQHSCRTRSKKRFQRWIQNPQIQVPSSFRDVVYNWGIYQSDAQIWERFFQLYIQESDPQEKLRRLIALTFTQDKVVMQKFLRLAKNESIVRKQDYPLVIYAISQNDAAKEFFQGGWESQGITLLTDAS